MSGGYIEPQEQHDHQVVQFTFLGKIDADVVDQWNNFVRDLKSQNSGVVAVTLVAKPTPNAFRPGGTGQSGPQNGGQGDS